MMVVVEDLAAKEPDRMCDICTYQIKVQDQVDENDLNANSPIQMTVVGVGMATTLLTICADQSGLIGLLRHLHGRGFVLLAVLPEEP
jgi:hypothetical protein